MATVSEYNHTNIDLKTVNAARFYETEPGEAFTMTQLNTFNEYDHPLLQNNTSRNISDTFVEKYKSELRCLQNPVKKWMTLQPENWTSNEVIDWLYCFADQNSIDCSTFRAEAFQDKIGQDLCFMHQEQFEELDPIYGKQIYDTFKCLLGSCTDSTSTYPNVPVMNTSENFYTDLINANFTDPIAALGFNDFSYQATFICDQNKALNAKWINYTNTNDNYSQKLNSGTPTKEYDTTETESVQSASHSSSSEDCSPLYSPSHSILSTPQIPCSSASTDYAYQTNPNNTNPNNTTSHNITDKTNERCTINSNTTVVSQRKQTRGRRPGQGSKGTHLWEFIRDLLHDDKFCPDLIKWEDPNMGVFRFVRSETVAQMWGKKKNNTSMTYEKLSRAMRYYYKRGILVRVDGRRLVYRFGPQSFGWKKMCVNSKIIS